MGAFGQSLRDTLKRLAYRTSVDQLKKRGVKQVNVVGLDRVAALIEEAVHRSLRRSLVGRERERVAGATKEEFLRLLKSNEALERSRDAALEGQQRAQEELDELRRELEQHRSALRDKLESGERELRAQYEGENQEILAKVNAVFVELADRPDVGLAELRDRMLELVMAVVDTERRTTLEARQAARDREVEILQRRIDKLTQSLGETETRLARAVSSEPVDGGISSIYREVQGLAADATHYERKKELMADIFRANLALQKGASA